MRTSTATYRTENDLTEKKPVVEAEFTGVTRRYSSDTYGDITGNHKKLIRRMRTELLSIDIVKGSVNFGHTEFEVADEGLDVTTLMKDNDLEGLDVTIRVGYQSLNIADFVNLPATKLRGPQLKSDYLGWRFVSRDIISKLDKKIFTGGPRTTVQAAYTSGGSTIQVASTTDFNIFPTGSGQLDWMRAYIQVGGDVMVYDSVLSGPVRFNNVTNGDLGSLSSDHAVGDEVKQVFGGSVINPMHLLLVVLMSGNPNTGDTGDNHLFYDIRAADGNNFLFGLDLDSNDVDVQQIEELGWKHFEERNEKCSFVIGDQPINALSWITKNILLPTGTYLYTRAGKICVGINDWFEINENYPSSPETILTADIDPDNSNMKIDHDNLINHFEVRFGSTWQRTVKVFKLDASETAYGLTDEPHVIESPVLSRSANVGWIKAVYARRWLYFFGNTHVDWTFDLLTKKWLFEAGDNANITFDKLPDLSDGTRGWTAMKSIITGMNVEWIPETKVTISGRSWEIFDRVTSLHTVTKSLTSGSGNLGFNATNDNTIDIGDDISISLSSVSAAQSFIAFIDLTEPGTATANDEYVSIGLHIQASSGVDNTADVKTFVRFSPSGSATHNLAFFITSDAEFNPFSIKCDFFARSGAGADDPTLNFKEVWAFKLDKTITEL